MWCSAMLSTFLGRTEQQLFVNVLIFLSSRNIDPARVSTYTHNYYTTTNILIVTPIWYLYCKMRLINYREFFEHLISCITFKHVASLQRLWILASSPKIIHSSPCVKGKFESLLYFFFFFVNQPRVKNVSAYFLLLHIWKTFFHVELYRWIILTFFQYPLFNLTLFINKACEIHTELKQIYSSLNYYLKNENYYFDGKALVHYLRIAL